MTEYITYSEVSRILSLSPRSAMRCLKSKGVNPISLGTGRGLGLRWNKIEVEAAIAGTVLVLPDKEEKKTQRQPLDKRPLVGRSTKEQLALINGSKLQGACLEGRGWLSGSGAERPALHIRCTGKIRTLERKSARPFIALPRHANTIR